MIRRALARRQSKVPALRQDHFVIPVAGFILMISLLASAEVLPWQETFTAFRGIGDSFSQPIGQLKTAMAGVVGDADRSLSEVAAVSTVSLKRADSLVGQFGEGFLESKSETVTIFDDFVEIIKQKFFVSNEEVAVTTSSFSTELSERISKTIEVADLVGSSVSSGVDETFGGIYSSIGSSLLGAVSVVQGISNFLTNLSANTLQVGVDSTGAVLADAQVGAEILTDQGQRVVSGLANTTFSLTESVSNIFSFLGQWSKNVWLVMTDNFRSAFAYVRDLTDDWRRNWIAFLGGQTEESVAVTPSTIISETDPELVKQIVRDELARLQAIDSDFPNKGVVVVPATGDEEQDAKLKEELSNAFSDEVNIRFDSTGRTGVITPVFRSTLGADYLFVLTPLKQ